MKKIDLVQTVSMFANLGVIAGIIFLGLELSQNNELMAAEARFNRLTIATESYTLVSQNPEFASLIARSDESLESLTAGEREQLLSYGVRVLINQQWSFDELPREEIPIERWRRVAQRGYWRMYWTERRDELSPEFRQWLEENVVDP
jgi:hypothetical protein